MGFILKSRYLLHHQQRGFLKKAVLVIILIVNQLRGSISSLDYLARSSDFAVLGHHAEVSTKLNVGQHDIIEHMTSTILISKYGDFVSMEVRVAFDSPLTRTAPVNVSNDIDNYLCIESFTMISNASCFKIVSEHGIVIELVFDESAQGFALNDPMVAMNTHLIRVWAKTTNNNCNESENDSLSNQSYISRSKEVSDTVSSLYYAIDMTQAEYDHNTTSPNESRCRSTDEIHLQKEFCLTQHPTLPCDQVDLIESDEVCIKGNGSLRTYTATLSYPYLVSLPRSVVTFCVTHRICPYHCARVTSHLSNMAMKLQLGIRFHLPAVQYLPTPEIPFVFLHIEKTAGTAVRQFVLMSAWKRQLLAFVPCSINVSCFAFTVADQHLDASVNVRHLSVLAGHFSWGVWNLLPSVRRTSGKRTVRGNVDEVKFIEEGGNHEESVSSLDNSVSISGSSRSKARSQSSKNSSCDSCLYDETSTNYKEEEQQHNCINNVTTEEEQEVEKEVEYVPPCLLFGREPVDRVISYYYERCYKKDGCPGQGRLINELSVVEFEAIVRNYRTIRRILLEDKRNGTKKEVAMIVDEGMSDAVCKTLVANENISRGKVLELIAEPDIVVVPPPGMPLSEAAVASALKNVRHCVVGLLENLLESKKLVNHWFPWLEFGNYTYRRTLLAVGDMRKKAWDLRPELKDIIVRYNQCDIKLYQVMIDIFNEEQRVVNSRELL